MLESRLQQHFAEGADLFNQAVDMLCGPLAEAARLLAASITSGGKILVAGADIGAFLAPILVAHFNGRCERERPALPALALRQEPGFDLVAQVQTLGQPGDVLLVLDARGTTEALLSAAQTAAEADLAVLALTGPEAAAWQHQLSEADVLICVPHDRALRIHETHLLMLHALCDAVDHQLLGELETD